MTKTTLDQPHLLYPDVIGINAKNFKNKPVAICDDEVLSWADFHRQTNKVANALLNLGLKKGDKVCLVMQTSIEMFVMIWGTVKAGGVTVPLNTMMATDSLALLINNSEAKLVFSDAAYHGMVDGVRDGLANVKAEGLIAFGKAGKGWRAAESLIEAASDAEPDVTVSHTDSMNIIYSSGSTGVPKGIEHSHFARLLYPLAYGPSLLIDRYSVAICSTPLYTNGTWITMLPAVYYGGTTILMRKFDAESFLSRVEKHKCTHAFMVPTQFIVLLESPAIDKYDVSSMRMLLSGGQALPTKTFDGLGKKFPTAGRFETYGQTEGFITVCSPDDYAKRGKAGSVGLPIFGGDICVIDENGKELPPGTTGEICGWSPGLMKGYYRDKKRTEEVIWIGPKGRTYLKSGDVGHVDEDGYVFISGRVKDMIKSGGINIFGSDIEEVFMRHPDVRECAAIGAPHDKWGETPILLAIMRDGAQATEQQLMEWGNARLGKWQRVSQVEFRTEFPRATHDKVLKRALRDPYWAGRDKKI